jgi:hypothetical protein
MGEKRDAYRYLVAKPEGKRPLAIPRGRCEKKKLKWILEE